MLCVYPAVAEPSAFGHCEVSDNVSVDPQLPVTLRPSRKQLVLLLVLSSVFVAAGIWMAGRGEKMGYYSVAFFGLCWLVFLIQLHPRAAYLHLEPSAFTFCSLFRKHSVPWTDVAQFAVIRVGLNRMVGWNFRPGLCRHMRAASVTRVISGYEAALPDTYGMKPQALAELLNRLREQYGTAHVEVQGGHS